MQALATVDDVARWHEEDLTEGMVRVAQPALETASDMARDIGDPSWTPSTVPGQVRRIIAAAVGRYLHNPDGYSQSRAADETLVWQDSDAPGEVIFSRREIEAIAKFGKIRHSSFGTVGMFAYSNAPARERNIWVPSDDHGADYPFNDLSDDPFPGAGFRTESGR